MLFAILFVGVPLLLIWWLVRHGDRSSDRHVPDEDVCAIMKELGSDPPEDEHGV